MSRHKYLFAVVIIALASCLVSAVNAQTFSDMGAGLTGAKVTTAVWGDYNGDGYLDLLVMGQNVSGVPTTRLYRSNAGASFTSVAAGFANVNAGPNAAAWGDYDRDGDLDLVLSGYNGTTGICNIYRNDAGAFTNIAAGITGIQFSAVAWGDYDRDGDLDLAIAGRTSTATQITRVYRNDAGVFTDIAAGLQGLEYANLAWADYDNDGDVDLLVTGSTGSASFTRLYRNDAGTFVNSGIAFAFIQSASIAWGDYNSDGRLDVALSGYNNGGTYYARIYRNDGGGTFTSLGDLSRKLAWGCLAWGDYDNDGDLDLATTGLDASLVGYTLIYRNDAGTFVDASAGLPAAQSSTVAWGDIDNDGRLDLAIAGMAGTNAFARIYRNTGGPANTLPTSPTGLVSAYDGGAVDLSWAAGGDAETPAGGLNYNVVVATPTGALKIAPHALASGFRLIPGLGNAQARLNLHLGSLTDGTYYWAVQSIDTAWAGAAPTSYEAFTIDTVPPFNCSIIIDGDAAFAGSKTVTLTLHSEDLLTTMEMRFSNDNTNWSAWEAYATSKSWDITDTDGTQTVYAEFRDLHHNVAPGVSDTIYLDKVAPTGTVVINSGDTYVGTKSVALTLDSTDPLGGGGQASGLTQMRFSNDSSTWSDWEAYGTSKSWDMTDADGTQTVYVQYKDLVGNIATYSDTIYLDKTAPTGTVVINAGDGYTATKGVTLTIDGTDASSGINQMSFSNDNSTWSAWEAYGTTKAWDLDPDTDGTKTVYVRFNDNMGNVSDGFSDDIYLDKIAPTGTLTINTGDAACSSRTVSLSWTASDNASGLKKIGFSNDDATYTWYTYYAGTKNWSMSIGEGTKTVYCKLEDNVGNISDSFFDTITLDQSGPTGTVVIKNGDPYTNSVGVTLTLSATDTYSTVTEMRFSNDDATWSAWATYATSRVWTMANVEGTQTVYVQFKDSLANVSASFADTIILDKTVPTGRSMMINGGATYTKSVNVTLTLSATDALSGVVSMRFRNSAATWSSWEPYSTSKAWVLPNVDGTAQVSVHFMDGAGNYLGVTRSIILDTFRPTVAIGAPSAVTTGVAPVSYAVTFSDTNGLAGVTLTAADVTLNRTGTANGTVAVTGSGSTRTVTISNPVGAGTLGISIAGGTATDVAGNTALAAGPSATFAVYAPPVDVSLDPTVGPLTFDAPMTFTTVVSDPNGYTNIRESRLLINDSTSTTNAIYVKYMPASNTIWLRNDAHTAWLGGRAPGSAFDISNSQCTVHCAATTANGVGNDLTVAWSITVNTTAKLLLGLVASSDNDGNADGWDTFGIYYTNFVPTNDSLVPSSGTLPTGLEMPFVATYSDGNGAADIATAFLLITDTGLQANGISVYYNAPQNKIYLRNDAGTTWSTGYAPGTPGVVLENSQGKLYVEHTTVTTLGNQMVISWALELKASMAGKNLFGQMQVYDKVNKGAATTRGIYYANVTPVNFSLTPNAGTLTSGSPITMTSVYRDANGWDNLSTMFLLLTENGGQQNTMSLYYNKMTNKLYLRDDLGTTWLGGYAPGTPMVVSNSQGSLDLGATTVSMSGTDITIGWSITLNPAFTAKNLVGQMTAYDVTNASRLDVKGTYYTNIKAVNVSVTPRTGSVSTGVPTDYTCIYRDANGASTIRQTNFLINTAYSFVNGVHLRYDGNTGKIYLRNDANSAWIGGNLAGDSVVLENSQCSVYLAATTVTAVGSDLTIKWNIELKPSMAAKTLKEYMYIVEGNNSPVGYNTMGTITTP